MLSAEMVCDALHSVQRWSALPVQAWMTALEPEDAPVVRHMVPPYTRISLAAVYVQMSEVVVLLHVSSVICVPDLEDAALMHLPEATPLNRAWGMGAGTMPMLRVHFWLVDVVLHFRISMLEPGVFREMCWVLVSDDDALAVRP